MDTATIDKADKNEAAAGHGSAQPAMPPSPDEPSPAETSPRRRSSATRPTRTVIGLAILVLGIIAAVAFGLHWMVVGRYIESTNNAYLRADQVAMAPRVSGYVAEIHVRDNQIVTRGQPLLRIDARRYDAAVRQAQATVETRQADLAKSEADLRLQDAVIQQAQADMDAARINMDLAQREYQRAASLARQGFVSQQKTDQLSSSLAQAHAIKELKDASLDAARRKIATLTAEIDQARAQLSAAQEALREAELDLSDTLLRSPMAGRIGDRTVRVGQFVQPGMRLLSVVPTGQIYLLANFKETQIERMRVGQPASIRIDAYPDQKLTGYVESFAPGTGAQFALLPPENATGNFTKVVQRVPVRIRIENPPTGMEFLIPGLSIEVSVDTKAAPRPPTRTANPPPES